MIKVVLVDDNKDLREGLQIMIEEHKDEFDCIGSFADAESAVSRIPLLKPDVVLMDINLPGMSGIQCVKKLKEKLSINPMETKTFLRRLLIPDRADSGPRLNESAKL